MRKWEETKHVATLGILGGCGIGVLLAGLLSGQGVRAAEWMVAICFVCLALVEVFSLRARKKPVTRRRSSKKYQGAKPPAIDDAPEGFYPDKDQSDISKGIVKKGGVNKKPTTTPPPSPKGQGGAVAEAEVEKAKEYLAKSKGGLLGVKKGNVSPDSSDPASSEKIGAVDNPITEKLSKGSQGGFTPPLSKSLFDEDQTKPKTDTGTLGFDKPGEGKE